ncbi:MAG: hypothetical protein KF805_06405 [Phycisphaeraceae bacterium]|nr:hypothetical protein [Phycisphaeraceae bacterium]
MDAHKPTPIEIPPPRDEATLLALYLEGVPLVQIARALQVAVQTVLDFIRTDEARQCIQNYEECIERQTRLYAQASRIPAMATLREVCASEGSLAERRRAASDLLRQSRAAEKPDKGRRFNRTPHQTPTPESFLPNPNIEPLPVPPPQTRPHHTNDLDANVLTANELGAHDLEAPPPAESRAKPPTPDRSEVDLVNIAISPQPSEPDQSSAHGSFIAHDHTASWHAFQHDGPGDSAPDIEPLADQAAPHATAPIDPPQIVTPVSSPPHIPSPFDAICPAEISSPLPDAVPVAA